MAKEQDFEIFSGNDAVLHCTIIDEDTEDPIDLSLYTAAIWGLAPKASSKTLKIEKSLLDGIEFTIPLEGKLDITIDAADTEGLKAQDYYHELRLTDDSGKKVTTIYGTVTILENLIRG